MVYRDSVLSEHRLLPGIRHSWILIVVTCRTDLLYIDRAGHPRRQSAIRQRCGKIGDRSMQTGHAEEHSEHACECKSSVGIATGQSCCREVPDALPQRTPL